jgi:hypothetical protein
MFWIWDGSQILNDNFAHPKGAAEAILERKPRFAELIIAYRLHFLG